MKLSYQLKKVRERLSKGLVDKGILRTEKRSFVVFDMATHPIVNAKPKRRIERIITETLMRRGRREVIEFRSISLILCSYAGNVIDNVLSNLTFTQREACYARIDEISKEVISLEDVPSVNPTAIDEISLGVLQILCHLDSIF